MCKYLILWSLVLLLCYWPLKIIGQGPGTNNYAASSDSNNRCPCIPRDQCPRVYGETATDVKELGFLRPCREFGTVRCCGVTVSIRIEHDKEEDFGKLKKFDTNADADALKNSSASTIDVDGVGMHSNYLWDRDEDLDVAESNQSVVETAEPKPPVSTTILRTGAKIRPRKKLTSMTELRKKVYPGSAKSDEETANVNEDVINQQSNIKSNSKPALSPTSGENSYKTSSLSSTHEKVNRVRIARPGGHIKMRPVASSNYAEPGSGPAPGSTNYQVDQVSSPVVQASPVTGGSNFVKKTKKRIVRRKKIPNVLAGSSPVKGIENLGNDKVKESVPYSASSLPVVAQSNDGNVAELLESPQTSTPINANSNVNSVNRKYMHLLPKRKPLQEKPTMEIDNGQQKLNTNPSSTDESGIKFGIQKSKNSNLHGDELKTDVIITPEQEQIAVKEEEGQAPVNYIPLRKRLRPIRPTGLGERNPEPLSKRRPVISSYATHSTNNKIDQPTAGSNSEGSPPTYSSPPPRDVLRRKLRPRTTTTETPITESQSLFSPAPAPAVASQSNNNDDDTLEVTTPKYKYSSSVSYMETRRKNGLPMSTQVAHSISTENLPEQQQQQQLHSSDVNDVKSHYKVGSSNEIPKKYEDDENPQITTTFTKEIEVTNGEANENAFVNPAQVQISTYTSTAPNSYQSSSNHQHHQSPSVKLQSRKKESGAVDDRGEAELHEELRKEINVGEKQGQRFGAFHEKHPTYRVHSPIVISRPIEESPKPAPVQMTSTYSRIRHGNVNNVDNNDGHHNYQPTPLPAVLDDVRTSGSSKRFSISTLFGTNSNQPGSSSTPGESGAQSQRHNSNQEESGENYDIVLDKDTRQNLKTTSDVNVLKNQPQNMYRQYYKSHTLAGPHKNYPQQYSNNGVHKNVAHEEETQELEIPSVQKSETPKRIRMRRPSPERLSTQLPSSNIPPVDTSTLNSQILNKQSHTRVHFGTEHETPTAADPNYVNTIEVEQSSHGEAVKSTTMFPSYRQRSTTIAPTTYSTASSASASSSGYSNRRKVVKPSLLLQASSQEEQSGLNTDSPSSSLIDSSGSYQHVPQLQRHTTTVPRIRRPPTYESQNANVNYHQEIPPPTMSPLLSSNTPKTPQFVFPPYRFAITPKPATAGNDEDEESAIKYQTPAVVINYVPTTMRPELEDKVPPQQPRQEYYNVFPTTEASYPYQVPPTYESQNANVNYHQEIPPPTMSPLLSSNTPKTPQFVFPPYRFAITPKPATAGNDEDEESAVKYQTPAVVINYVPTTMRPELEDKVPPQQPRQEYYNVFPTTEASYSYQVPPTQSSHYYQPSSTPMPPPLVHYSTTIAPTIEDDGQYHRHHHLHYYPHLSTPTPTVSTLTTNGLGFTPMKSGDLSSSRFPASDVSWTKLNSPSTVAPASYTTWENKAPSSQPDYDENNHLRFPGIVEIGGQKKAVYVNVNVAGLNGQQAPAMTAQQQAPKLKTVIDIQNLRENPSHYGKYHSSPAPASLQAPHSTQILQSGRNELTSLNPNGLTSNLLSPAPLLNEATFYNGPSSPSPVLVQFYQHHEKDKDNFSGMSAHHQAQTPKFTTTQAENPSAQLQQELSPGHPNQHYFNSVPPASQQQPNYYRPSFEQTEFKAPINHHQYDRPEGIFGNQMLTTINISNPQVNTLGSIPTIQDSSRTNNFLKYNQPTFQLPNQFQPESSMNNKNNQRPQVWNTGLTHPSSFPSSSPVQALNSLEGNGQPKQELRYFHPTASSIQQHLQNQLNQNSMDSNKPSSAWKFPTSEPHRFEHKPAVFMNPPLKAAETGQYQPQFHQNNNGKNLNPRPITKTTIAFGTGVGEPSRLNTPAQGGHLVRHPDPYNRNMNPSSTALRIQPQLQQQPKIPHYIKEYHQHHSISKEILSQLTSPYGARTSRAANLDDLEKQANKKDNSNQSVMDAAHDLDTASTNVDSVSVAAAVDKNGVKITPVGTSPVPEKANTSGDEKSNDKQKANFKPPVSTPFFTVGKSEPAKVSVEPKPNQDAFQAPTTIERGFLPILPYSEKDPGPLIARAKDLNVRSRESKASLLKKVPEKVVFSLTDGLDTPLQAPAKAS